MAEGHAGRALRALVVDDDPVSRAFAGEALVAIGFAVTEVDSGREAIRHAASEPPHLIILDLRMPGMDGFETCVALRQQPECEAVPIMVVTGVTDAATIERAFDVGASDFIKKPIDWRLFAYRVRFVMRAYGAFRDLTDTLEHLEESRQQLFHAQRIARIGHYELELESGDMTWGSELRRILEADAALPESLDSFLSFAPAEEREVVMQGLRQVARSGESWTLEHRIGSEPGAECIIWHHAELKGTPTDSAAHIRGTIQDITERRRSEERIRYLAYYDSLTGVPNRNYLREQLPAIVDRARAQSDSVALLCVDLDRFKRINDSLGCAIGDEVLGAVVQRLRDCVRSTDLVGRVADDEVISRLAGDEFIVVLCGVGAPENVHVAARRLITAFDMPFLIGDQQVSVSASIGIALAPDDASDSEGLLASAELAMENAKKSGGRMHCFFDSSMNETAQRRYDLEQDVRQALEGGEYRLAYQPLIDLEQRQIVAVESLLRWDHPTRGPISPASFIPLAEELGLIVDVFEWTFRESCLQAAAWDASGLAPIRMSVNISAVVFRRIPLVERIVEILAETGLSAERLEIEITESAVLGDEDRAAVVLERLRGMGVRVALDDFGTGCSSLTHLVQLPIDCVKIDRTFVMGIGPDQPASSVVAGVIAMAHHLGFQVVAEGVETEPQASFLRALGCDLYQGFRFARAVRPDVIERMLRTGAIYDEPEGE
jgi:diguanylate cyclase (GGDEF)-like protein